MYIVYYTLGKEKAVKHFSDYQQAWDFAEMLDNCEQIVHCDPTSTRPTIVKWHNKPAIKTECDYGMTLEQAGVQECKEPLVMPVIPRNEYELILEEALTKMYGLVKGMAEQLKRLGGH